MLVELEDELVREDKRVREDERVRDDERVVGVWSSSIIRRANESGPVHPKHNGGS